MHVHAPVQTTIHRSQEIPMPASTLNNIVRKCSHTWYPVNDSRKMIIRLLHTGPICTSCLPEAVQISLLFVSINCQYFLFQAHASPRKQTRGWFIILLRNKRNWKRKRCLQVPAVAQLMNTWRICSSAGVLNFGTPHIINSKQNDNFVPCNNLLHLWCHTNVL